MGLPALLRVELGPGVRAAFTTRVGGASVPPYDTLNLGSAVGDDRVAVAANRVRATAAFGAATDPVPGQVTWARQVHGSAVAVVRAPGAAVAGDCDALVATMPGAVLGICGADCLPVLIADAGASVVAAAHVGRRGLVGGVVPAAVSAMVALGADPGSMRAAVGPGIGACCYEVDLALAQDYERMLPSVRAVTRWATAGLDLRAGAHSVLASAGVHDVADAGGCTACQPELYFSHRRDGRTGRQAGLVALTPAK